MAELHPAADLRFRLSCGILLFRQVQQGEYALRGGLHLLHITQAESHLFQRRREPAGEQDDRNHRTDRNAVPEDQPAAQDRHGNIGQCVHKGDGGLHDRGQEIAEDSVLLVAPGKIVILLLHFPFPAERLGRGVIGIGFLRQGREFAAQVVMLVPVLFAQRRHPGGQEYGKRGQQDHGNRHTPVRQEQNDRDHRHLQEAGQQDLHDPVYAVGHGAYILHHPVDHVPRRRPVHIGHGQAAQLFGQADPETRAEVAADNVVQEPGVAIGYARLDAVDQQQHAQAGQQAFGQAGYGRILPFIKPVDQAAQELRLRHGTADQDQAEERAEQDPAPEGPDFPHQAFAGLVKEPALFLLFFFLFPFVGTHTASPPVWEI